MSATVLVVDDNDDNVRILSRILTGRGYQVRVARDGFAALESVRQQPPQVVLLDVMMPGMDGMQVLEQLRGDARTAGIPVIMVTARTQDEDVLAGYKFGADYYVTKPFTLQQILYAIGFVLGQATPNN